MGRDVEKTGTNLQLLDDIDMVNMIQKGIRGDVSMITQKYGKANNPKVPDYDEKAPRSWIAYLDMNDLYGAAMEESLPEKDFTWMSEEQIATLDVTKIADDSDSRYVLEVDLEYPVHLHDLDNDYPLAPEPKLVTDDMQSKHSSELKAKIQIKGKPSVKLVPNLSNKTKYVLHYRNLKLYLAYIVQEFVGLRSKMYSLKYEVILENDQGEILKYSKDKKTAKGVSRAVIDKQLKHDAYRDCLFQQTSMNHEMNFIRSHCHQLYSFIVNKTSLSPYDDKRYVSEDGFHTLVHGHYKIP